jgi:hypothetical protein
MKSAQAQTGIREVAAVFDVIDVEPDAMMLAASAQLASPSFASKASWRRRFHSGVCRKAGLAMNSRLHP